MSQAWFGILGVVVGGLVTGGVSLWREWFITKREREARQALREQERKERRDTFERETLLALQDAVEGTRQGSVALRDRKACRHSALPYPALQHER
jgi:hypothetical protein